MVEVKANEESAEEKRKLEELRKLKTLQKEKKKKEKEEAAKIKNNLPPIGGDALPALQLGGRKGNFEMIPDFLKNNKQNLID